MVHAPFAVVRASIPVVNSQPLARGRWKAQQGVVAKEEARDTTNVKTWPVPQVRVRLVVFVGRSQVLQDVGLLDAVGEVPP